VVKPDYTNINTSSILVVYICNNKGGDPVNKANKHDTKADKPVQVTKSEPVAKKKTNGLLIGLLFLVVVAGLIGGGLYRSHHHAKTVHVSKARQKACADPVTKNGFTIHKACNILTQEIAAPFAGNHIKAPLSPESASDVINVSFSQYYGDKGQASLTVRSPLNKKAEQINQRQFAAKTRPAGVESVSGFGDSAYWDPAFHLMSILKHNTWYILSAGPQNDQNRTLDQSKELAKKLIDQM
jgi:hypothetical protein